LQIANISPLTNQVEVTTGMQVYKLQIPAYAAKILNLDTVYPMNPISIKASERVRAAAFNTSEELIPRLAKEDIEMAKDKVYFVFGSASGPQFTVGLSNPDHISRARKLIANPNSLGGILSAKVGFGNHNHNLKLNSQPTWSWEVEEVFGFYDFGSTECNGNAQALEEIAEEWIGAGKPICFWTSKPLKELSH
jgi:hypothetical protein